MEQNTEKVYKYKLCTRCITYNHAPYIVDAMNGFTMQETTFPVITLIIDDASTDGEPEVIRQYLSENFQEPYRTEETDDYNLICANHKTNENCIFVVFLLKYNHYSIKKPKMPYLSEWLENSKYHALCEGDDYWTHPKKLLMQADYLEKHADCGLVYAKAKVYNEKEKTFKGICGEDYVSNDEMLIHNPVVTLTTCYRTDLWLNYNEEKKDWPTMNWKMGDYPMWIWLAHHASVCFLDEDVAVYREVQGSMTHKTLEDRLAFIHNTAAIQFFFADYFKKTKKMKKEIEYNEQRSSALACIKYNDYKQSLKYLIKLGFKDQLFCLKHVIQKRIGE